jgi:hypothetical protein
MSTQHTPTPWQVDASKHSVSIVADRFCVAQTATAQTGNVAPAEANAAFIVRACNAHDELVAALRELLWTEQFDDDDPRLIAARLQSRAALAKASK